MALHTAGKAIEWSIQQNNPNRIAESYLNRAGLLQSSGQHQSAIQDFKKVLSTDRQYRLNRADLIGPSYIGIVNSLCNLGQYDEGIRFASEGIAESVLITQPEMQQELLRWKAKCLAELNRFNEAASILEDVLKRAIGESSRENETKTLLQLGVLFEKSGDFRKSEDYLKRAKELASSSGASELLIQSNDALASVYRQTYNTEMELMTRNSNIALNQQSNDMSGVVIQNFEIGNAYLQKGDLNLAEDFIVKAKDLSPIHSKDGNLIQGGYSSAELRQGALALKNLASEFQKKNELEKALKYYRDYAEMLDSAQSLQQKELENALVLSSDLGRNQQRIDWLEKENELSLRNMNLLKDENALKESQVSRRNTIIFSLVSLLLAAIVFAFLLYRNTKARRRSEQIVALQSMIGQMNPHFIFNALNSVNEYIAKNDEREANRFITSFSRLMRRVLDDSGRTFISLADELEMLKVYLQLENSRFPDKFSYQIDVSDKLNLHEIYIPPMMIQPLAENAIWHGLRYRESKGLLKLDVNVENERLIIDLEDNGVGMKKSALLKTQNQQQQKSHALANMKKRMQLLNELYHCDLEMSASDANSASHYPGTRVLLAMKLMTSDLTK